jgi:hypothetical protein
MACADGALASTDFVGSMLGAHGLLELPETSGHIEELCGLLLTF